MVAERRLRKHNAFHLLLGVLQGLRYDEGKLAKQHHRVARSSRAA